MIRYVVTALHGGLEANLAKPGHWGGMRYPSIRAAEDAARLDAGTEAFTIEHERVTRPRREA